MNQERKNPDFPILVCADNALLRDYLELEFEEERFNTEFVSREELIRRIPHLKKNLLVLQTDGDEFQLLETCRRIKMIHGYETRIIFLSTDYSIEEDANNVTDKFMQFPVLFKDIDDAIQKFLTDTHKILIIDDSKLVHNHLIPPLSSEGYKIYEAFDGQEGLEMALEHKPDLIICDIEMPRMNGFEVCASIRSRPEISDTYIIMSSTLGSASDIQKGFNAGVDEYITKPVVIGEMIERINRHFKQSLSGRENIIFLERDEQIISSFSKSLRKQGFSVRAASTINETIDLVKKYSFDLIISEMELGEETAMNLCLSLKNVDMDNKPSILVLTDRESNSDYKMIMNLQVSGIISKPFSTDTLLATVERVLADRRTNAERKQMLKYLSKSSAKIASEKAILSRDIKGKSEKRYTSILFADIVNFTARCEKYEPASVVEQINMIFDMIAKIIHTEKGDVDKFMGDACLAYWLDSDRKAGAVHLIDSILEVQKHLDEVNNASEILKNDPIRIRFGANSGESILCDIGSFEARIDLTIIGDHVNLAARLEAAGKQYGLETLLSENTYLLVEDRTECREIDRIRVYGKSVPVPVYELFGKKGKLKSEQKELIGLFLEAKRQYIEGNFQKAKNGFILSDRLEKMHKDRKTNPSRVFAQRCMYLLKNPPKNWDGTWSIGK